MIRSFNFRTFNPKPSESFLAAVNHLRGLDHSEGLETVIAAFAAAVADDGEAYAKSNGAKRAKLSERNVGLLLPGIPESLLDSICIDDLRHESLSDAWGRRQIEAVRRERAIRKRKDVVAYIANRNGWMDHGHLFFKDGQPHSVVGNPYELRLEHIAQLAWIADTWGLKIHISGRSSYYPGWTCRVALYRPDREATSGEAPE